MQEQIESKLEREERILTPFTPEQQKIITERLEILSTLAYFIGKDFRIPVELNEMGQGWHWDFQNNVIRADPKDLLEKPMDYLRFVISHEGGHRRISRIDGIPIGQWQEPGFSFLMNAIEDPRDNNFVAENYPKFKEQMALAYTEDLDFEAKSKDKAAQKLGYQPRFMQAGFEYIKQWFRETQGNNFEMTKELNPEVSAVVAGTLESAKDAWWRYPSREEADDKDTGEENIKEYARVAYEIIVEEIWPEFKKLVEQDKEVQKLAELLNDQQGKKEGPKTEEESRGGKPKAVPLDSLTIEQRKQLREEFDALPEEKKKELGEKAEKTIEEFSKELAKGLEGKLTENPEEKAEREERESKETKTDAPEKPSEKIAEISKDWQKKEKERDVEGEMIRKKLEELFENENKSEYEKTLAEVSELIDLLTADLREVFTKRKMEKHETDFRSGRRWNIRKRIREKVAGIPLFKTEAREQPESESEETDYAITLLIDLSGSMNGSKIKEAFKSAIVLAETLNNLGIKFEVVGFQDILLEFKSFGDGFNEQVREKMNQILLEVCDKNPDGHNNCGDNDDGACLLEASRHLAVEQTKNKFLIVLSDGQPAMDSGRKSSSQLGRELTEAVAEITGSTSQKLIGIGLLSNAVSTYYENNIAGVTTEELVETLGGLLREIIER